MNKEYIYFIMAAIVCGILSVYKIVFAIYDRKLEKQMMNLPGRTTGTITGLLRSHLFKNDTYGNVPGGTIIGWGVAQGEQFWGGTLKMRIPPWFPCVTYEVDGKEYCKLMGEGNYKDAWKIGQEVTVLYEAGNPQKAMIQGDHTYRIKSKLDLIAGIVLLIGCVICVGIIITSS